MSYHEQVEALARLLSSEALAEHRAVAERLVKAGVLATSVLTTDELEDLVGSCGCWEGDMGGGGPENLKEKFVRMTRP